MKRALMLAVVLAASSAYAGDFGVQLNIDMPLDPANVTAAVSNPAGFIFQNTDVLSLSAFYEQGNYGVRVDFLSASEARLGVYRTLSRFELPFGGYQADTGVYTGYNWHGDGFFIRLRTRLILYGCVGPECGFDEQP